MVKAIVGANWGDEGKGKITDVLANDSDIVIRFQGGANALRKWLTSKIAEFPSQTLLFLTEHKLLCLTM